MPRGQKVSPHHWGRRKTHFLVRTYTIFGADVHDPKGCRKTLYKKSFALIFWPLYKQNWDSAAPSRSLSGLAGPKSQKSLDNVSWGLRHGNPEKSLQEVSDTPASLREVSRESVGRVFLECPRVFVETSWGPGSEAPGDIFETFSAFRARRARETPCKGRVVERNQSVCWCLVMLWYFRRVLIPGVTPQAWPLNGLCVCVCSVWVSGLCFFLLVRVVRPHA